MILLLYISHSIHADSRTTGRLCEYTGNNTFSSFCKTCTDTFHGLDMNPWIRYPTEAGLLLDIPLDELTDRYCEIYNPAAICNPNVNLKGINFTLKGERNQYLYVDYMNVTEFNFMDLTIYIQCRDSNIYSPYCFLVTLVAECPYMGLSLMAQVSITLVVIAIAVVFIVLILVLAIYLIRQQSRLMKDDEEEAQKYNSYKYTQM